MGLPRSSYVKDGEIGVYHCFTRCVRRAFLSGFDPVTGRDFSHRKAWILNRLHFLAGIFAIDVCAYAIMDNHYHSVLRTRPDLVQSWTDLEVAARWLTLCPNYHCKKHLQDAPTDQQISALASDSHRIAQLRKRLSSISWFMGRLNEFIARQANIEDNLKGRFWESRFKCRPLLDLAAIAACMVYVDLNPIRAGLAPTPELSDFTSIQQRIRSWHSQMPAQDFRPSEIMQLQICNPKPSPSHPSHSWLCPIQLDANYRGILQMTDTEYFILVDSSGRILHSGKRGAIDPDLLPILQRFGINPDTWLDTISQFESRFHLAAGAFSSLRTFAHQLGKRWLAGFSAARIAFSDPPLDPA